MKQNYDCDIYNDLLPLLGTGDLHKNTEEWMTLHSNHCKCHKDPVNIEDLLVNNDCNQHYSDKEPRFILSLRKWAIGIIVLLVSIIIVLTVFIYNAYINLERFDSLMFNNLTQTSFNLQKAADNMTLYDEDFLEREKTIFKESIYLSAVSINWVGTNLNWLPDSKFNWRRNLYEENLFTIEKVLVDISRGNITDPTIIQAVSQVLARSSQDLSNLLYVEQIGLVGLRDPDIQTRIIDIFSKAKEDVSRIIQ
jgi:hypothetical protein